MKRESAISIKNSDLLKLLKKYASAQDSRKIVDDIVEFALANPVNRYVIVTNKTNRKKIVRSISINVELFNRILNSVRIKNNHNFSRMIMKTDKEYLMLCDVSNDAEEFCKLFELDYSIGFIEYCQIGLDKIGKNYSLNKFKSYKSKIFTTKERMDTIARDPDPKKTMNFSSTYLDKCSIDNGDQRKRLFKTYNHDFIYAKLQCESCGGSYSIWVDAQFDGLKYLDIVPEPYQLHGEEAEKRYDSYIKKSSSDWRTKAMIKIKESDSKNKQPSS